jgi:hypothetical protein
MSDGLKFYAVRQFRSGAVLGSRAMTADEAAREVTSWREHIGLAAVVPDMPEVRRAVRANDSEKLWQFLLDHEPKVWVSTTSHRARYKLGLLARDEHLGGLTPYGVWPADGGWPHGDYYQMPARLADRLARIKSARVLRGAPKGRLFKRWNLEDTGGPQHGNWPVPA